MEHNQPKIAVVGLGGVGGYLASMLARTYEDVTVVARGERFDAVSERGLCFSSELFGSLVTHPRVVRDASELGVVDYLFISVKNYSLEGLLPHLSGAVGEDTVIIPVMNGVDPGERVRAGVKGGTLVKALIYIVSYAMPDYSIRQEGKFARLVVGIDGPKEREKLCLERLDALLSGAEIYHEVSENITLDIWNKYILNCAYNVATAYYDCNIGPIRADKERTAIYERLVREAYQVGRAKGIPLEEAQVQKIMDLFGTYREDASSSLQRDMHAGKPSEVDTFSGYIVSEGKRLGVEVSASQMAYEALKERENRVSMG